MKYVDKLIMKAMKIRPQHDLCIISNATGRWIYEGQEFDTFEAAEAAAEEYFKGYDSDFLIIINDAGPAPERKMIENERTKVKNENTNGCAPDTYQSNEYGCKRENGCKKSKYHHSWV